MLRSLECGFGLRTSYSVPRTSHFLAALPLRKYNEVHMTSAPQNSRELAGKIAVVTGSSSGIGRAIAIELAAAGAAVIVHTRRNRAGAEETVRKIEAAKSSATILNADLSDAASHASLVEQAFAWRDRVDIWINNAGADVLTGKAAGWSFEKKLQTLWQVDVLATINLSRLAGARMQDQDDGGVILNQSWDQITHGMAGDSGEMFAATKGAIASFSKSLAQSLAPKVRVNCLAPGWIRTAWGEKASEYWNDRACKESLVGRWGAPEDVARAARFLASPAASFITGQFLPVNGGFRVSSKDAESDWS